MQACISGVASVAVECAMRAAVPDQHHRCMHLPCTTSGSCGLQQIPPTSWCPHCPLHPISADDRRWDALGMGTPSCLCLSCLCSCLSKAAIAVNRTLGSCTAWACLPSAGQDYQVQLMISSTASSLGHATIMLDRGAELLNARQLGAGSVGFTQLGPAASEAELP